MSPRTTGARTRSRQEEETAGRSRSHLQRSLWDLQPWFVQEEVTVSAGMKAELLPLTDQLTGEENRVCSSVSATKTDLTDSGVCQKEDFSLTAHTKHCTHFI